MRRVVIVFLAMALLASALVGCGGADVERQFDGERAYRQVVAQCDLGPRPTGSRAGWATGDYIIAELERQKWAVETQEFTYRDVRARNVVGRRGRGPVVILGAHYDTRPRADRDPVDTSRPILGANDGASGVAVLLELARTLEDSKLNNEVWLAFFDAEDRGQIDGWPFSVGASQMAEGLTTTPEYVIVVDMVGDAEQQLYVEKNSDPELTKRIWGLAADLGYREQFIPRPKWALIDDHIPFRDRGVVVVDIIDFDYPHWHTTQDTADKVSATSLERVGRVLEALLEGSGAS